jgi:hypothetical protein
MLAAAPAAAPAAVHIQGNLLFCRLLLSFCISLQASKTYHALCSHTLAFSCIHPIQSTNARVSAAAAAAAAAAVALQ